MTWTAVGITQGNFSTNLSLSNQGIGDLIVAEVINYSNSTVWCTGLSGGGATWVQAGVKFSGTANAFSAAVFLGTVTATGTGTATVSWSGTAPAQFGIASREFTSTVGSWSFITQGNLDSAGTANWPSLSAAAGDLYFGFAANAAAATAGSTSGYTYDASADSAGNGMAFNVNCPSGATFPVWGDSGQALGIAVLIREGAAAAPAAPAPLPALPGRTWLRRFRHPQAAPQPPPPPPPPPPAPPSPFPAAPGATWRRRFQHRQAVPQPVPPVLPYIAGLGGSGWSSWFTDQFGSPRLAVIEQGWALPWNAGRWNSGDWQADFTSYFSNRAAQGYTAWYGVAWGLAHIDPTALSGGRSWDGVYPLLISGTPGAIATGAETITLNGTFWARIDAMFATARRYGISCFLNMSLSYDRSDVGSIWTNATNTQGNAFGAALAARYPQSSYPHVFWFFGDDDGGANDTFYQNILNGIQGAGDTRPLISIEQDTNTNSHVEYDTGAAYGGSFGATNATYNWVYSYDAPYFGIERSYTEGGTFAHIPPVYGDGIYYGDSGGGPSVQTAIRTFVWWALASGSRGFPSTSGASFADADAVWIWGTANAPGRVTSDPNGSWTTTAVGRVAAFFSGLADWWKLIPDTGSTFITAGRGTRGTCDPPSSGFNVRTGNTYVAGSITPSGTLAVIYCRASMSITIDQSKLGAGYTATWVDPSNPALTQSATTGSTYSSAGLGNNAAGDPDWVLVLQGPPVSPATAGVATATAVAAAPTVAVSVTAGVAAAASTAPAPVISATASAGIPASAATAPALQAAAGALAGVAAGSAVAPAATVTTSAGTSAPAGVAAVSALALAPPAAITASAAAAAASATALQPAIAGTAAPGPAAAAGVSLAPTAAAAVLPAEAAALARAMAPVPAVTVPGAVAGSLAIALAPGVSTSGNTNAPAAVATASGSAPSPVAAVAVPAGIAAASATAPAATGQASRLASAGVAAASGTALAPALALTSIAHATAAAALASAPAPLVSAPPPFTVGTLTAAAAPLAVLTATDQRTGGS